MPSVTLQNYAYGVWTGSCGTTYPLSWDAQGCAVDTFRGRAVLYRDQYGVIPIGSKISSVTWGFSCYSAVATLTPAGQFSTTLTGNGISDSVGVFTMNKTDTIYPQTDNPAAGIWVGDDVSMEFLFVNKESFYSSTHYVTPGSVVIDYTPPGRNLFFGSTF